MLAVGPSQDPRSHGGTLGELGIDKHQSTRWQLEAKRKHTSSGGKTRLGSVEIYSILYFRRARRGAIQCGGMSQDEREGAVGSMVHIWSTPDNESS